MELGTPSKNIQPLRPPITRETSTQHIPPALYAWVNRIANNAASPTQALERIRQELTGWTYDLNAPIDNEHPIASFLQNKRGHCELFATTLTLAARVLGIPSRMINGYYGGDWNDNGHFFILRQQHAHSWSEVWLNHHWQQMDATPPSRWLLSGVQFSALDAFWEPIKLSWYRYVLEFQNQDRQALFDHLIQIFKQSMLWLVFIIIVSVILWQLQHRLQQQKNKPTHQQLTQQLRILDWWLKKHGYERPIAQPVRHIPPPSGVAIEQWKQWVQAWEEHVYQHHHTWHWSQLLRRLRALSNARW